MAKLLNKARVDNGLRIASDISEDGQAATVLFDNLHVNLNQKREGPLTEEKLAVVTIRADDVEDGVMVETTLQGSVEVTGPGKAVLVAHLCGTTHVAHLPDPYAKEQAFTCSFDSVLGAESDYRAVLMLLAERNSHTAEVNIHLSVHSMDLEFNKTAK